MGFRAERMCLNEAESKGIEIGKRVEKMETAKNLIKLGISFDNIAEATKLDLLEIKASGGIKTSEDAIKFIEAGATRLGTSSGVEIVNGKENK